MKTRAFQAGLGFAVKQRITFSLPNSELTGAGTMPGACGA